MRTKVPLYSLTRQLVRPSWNKYNLFNLSRKTVPSIQNKTMYQQKWAAKKETRAYHGDHINERQFKSLWDRKLIGVLGENPKDPRPIPLASQTYASLERRLDIAVFRALFASSSRQAKQIIVHGKVKVNGRQVKQPGYTLRPGDLFEVDPAAVIMNVSSPVVGTPSVSTSADADNTDAVNEQDESEVSLPEGNAGAEGQKVAVGTVRRNFWELVGHEQFVPKPFMSAFAFVPAYLEVSFETCSAVYLRDPVARPNRSEVPSPHPNSVHVLANNFYQRGR